jgi:RAB protein geranylgeranyltransferase component A
MRPKEIYLLVWNNESVHPVAYESLQDARDAANSLDKSTNRFFRWISNWKGQKWEVQSITLMPEVER